MKKLILIPLIVIGLIVVILFANSFIAREKLYYVPQIGIYLKTISYPKDEFGYILFSKDSNLTLCSKVDYIAVSKQTGDRCAIIFTDPSKKNELHFFIRFGTIYKKNQVHYKLIIHNTDLKGVTEFYKNGALSTKKPYFNIEVSDLFESVSVSNYNDKFLHELKPLN
jgi:hypothetical protein